MGKAWDGQADCPGMTTVCRLTVVLVLSAVLAWTPTPALAQDPPSVEIAGGYQYMWDKELEESFPTGWFVSGAGHLTSRLAVVGEIAGSHKTERDADFKASFSLYTFMGGVRLSLTQRSSTVRPFVQLLGGMARASASVDVAGMRLEESLTEPAVQPGGGVDIQLSPATAARVMVDYRRTFFDAGDSGNEVRVAAGVVLRF